MVFNPVDRFFWAVAIIVLFISGLNYFYQGLKKENLNEKLMMINPSHKLENIEKKEILKEDPLFNIQEKITAFIRNIKKFLLLPWLF